MGNQIFEKILDLKGVLFVLGLKAGASIEEQKVS
jgi:hypothetical protein